MATSLLNTFDRVVVVNLARRPLRLARFRSVLKNWPFKWPERFEAVDGASVPAPPSWTAGIGAWGCQRSHHAVLDAAVNDRLSSILVLEDDAYPILNFAAHAEKFLQNVPKDWDCLMLGAQHLRPPLPVSEGVVRCVASNRTHAYAVRGKFLKTLRDVWNLNKTDHCDLVLSSLMRVFKAYSPDPLLIGQDGGESDVTQRREQLRFLSPQDVHQIAAADPRHLIAKLATHAARPNSQIPAPHFHERPIII